jgi:hypothetical protein
MTDWDSFVGGVLVTIFCLYAFFTLTDKPKPDCADLSIVIDGPCHIYDHR